MAHLLSVIFIFSTVLAFAAEENFLLVNGKSGESLIETGPHIDERLSPCSTFKIALSLMGFDSGILQNEKSPIWLFKEGYDDFVEAWKRPQTPEVWMRDSCVWYSKVLAERLGMQKLQFYLARLNYGNQDASGGLTSAWLSSSLKISTREQVAFLQKMLKTELALSHHAITTTRQILFLEDLPSGWKLFGKTGWSGSTSSKDELGWFIGWIEKEDNIFPFAYNIRENKINLSQRIPRVKELIAQANVMKEKPGGS